MYSPRIDERLIPVLYQEAKARKMTMVALVNRLLWKCIFNDPELAVRFATMEEEQGGGQVI